MKAYYVREKGKDGLAFLAYGRTKEEAIANHCKRNGFKDESKFEAHEG